MAKREEDSAPLCRPGEWRSFCTVARLLDDPAPRTDTVVVASPYGASPFENGDGGNPIFGGMRLRSRLTGKFSDRV